MTPTKPPVADDEAMRIAEIIERVEAATEDSAVLDCAISATLYPERFGNREDAALYARPDWTRNRADWMYLRDLGMPRYTASLDAAMTLVPENADAAGELFRLEAYNSPGVLAPHVRASAWVAGAPRVYAATPALALCAAALSARAALQNEGTGDGQ